MKHYTHARESHRRTPIVERKGLPRCRCGQLATMRDEDGKAKCARCSSPKARLLILDDLAVRT